MAKEQIRTIALVIAVISLLLGSAGSVVAVAWKGSGRLTSAEKDIETGANNAVAGRKIIADNQAEDRKAIEKVAEIMSDLRLRVNEDIISMKEKHNIDYRELKADAENAKLRDERQATQYAAILSHMARQTINDTRSDISLNAMQVDIGKMQAQMETLTKD